MIFLLQERILAMDQQKSFSFRIKRKETGQNLGYAGQ
jgi:hypothetical protein